MSKFNKITEDQIQTMISDRFSSNNKMMTILRNKESECDRDNEEEKTQENDDFCAFDLRLAA